MASWAGPLVPGESNLKSARTALVRHNEPLSQTPRTEKPPTAPRKRSSFKSPRQLEEKAAGGANRPFTRPVHENAHSEETNQHTRKDTRRERPALVRALYTPRMQISGSKGPAGGATLAHWSGEKEACISPDPDIRTHGTAIFPKTKSLGWRFRRSSGRGVAAGGRRGGVEAMVGGWRKMAAV